jgi:hypothetical protein
MEGDRGEPNPAVTGASRLAQRCYIDNWKFVERVHRPKEIRWISLVLVLFSFRLLTGQNRRAIWNKSLKVERGRRLTMVTGLLSAIPPARQRTGLIRQHSERRPG